MTNQSAVVSKTTIFVALIFFTLISVVFTSQNANAGYVDKPCKKVEVLFARGSGKTLTGNDNTESAKFHSELSLRLGGDALFNYYELGTEKYGGFKYPAVQIDENFYKMQ